MTERGSSRCVAARKFTVLCAAARVLRARAPSYLRFCCGSRLSVVCLKRIAQPCELAPVKGHYIKTACTIATLRGPELLGREYDALALMLIYAGCGVAVSAVRACTYLDEHQCAIRIPHDEIDFTASCGYVACDEVQLLAFEKRACMHFERRTDT